MTDDKLLLDLLQRAAAARAEVVMVGDHRQLGAVGPGGGFEALVARYGRRCTSWTRTCDSALMIRSDDGTIHRLEGPEIGAERLAHSYAVTVHRSQGATVERAHALEDGGGRELAYVKMSRAKDRTSVYVVADSMPRPRTT